MSEKTKDSTISNIKLENEQKYLAYLMRNPNESLSIKSDYFLNPEGKLIHKGLTALAKKGLKFEYDSLLTLIKEEDPANNIKQELLLDTYEKYSDFDNIAFVRDTLINDWLKNKVSKQIIEDIFTKTSQKDYLSVEDLKSFAEKLLHTVVDSASDYTLMTGKDLAENHEKVIELRDSGVRQRSMGFTTLNEVLTRPAAEEEITLIVGQKGSGKCLTGNTPTNIIVSDELYEKLLRKGYIKHGRKIEEEIAE